MAALVESGLRNLPDGDADSVGFFQMRVSIWNQGAYAGYADRPELQLDWFLDHAEAVKKQRIARGLPVDDPPTTASGSPTSSARPRSTAAATSCASTRRASCCASAGRRSRSSPTRAGGDVQRRLAGAGRARRGARSTSGTPYQWGGSTPQTGFDCSGLVQWAYAEAGIRIPRVTDQQILAQGGAKVGRSHLLPGDLVFFRDATGYVHHVGHVARRRPLHPRAAHGRRREGLAA